MAPCAIHLIERPDGSAPREIFFEANERGEGLCVLVLPNDKNDNACYDRTIQGHRNRRELLPCPLHGVDDWVPHENKPRQCPEEKRDHLSQVGVASLNRSIYLALSSRPWVSM